MVLKLTFLFLIVTAWSSGVTCVFYASSRIPRSLCYKDVDVTRDTIVQVPHSGCLTADQTIFCKFDWTSEKQVLHRKREVCCDGYQDYSGICVPKCLNGCAYGTCVAPEMCHCEPGFTGIKCDQVVPDCKT
ncbi:hypothetical protein HDE_11767 [Halotydeus destructor]|nr:hypothetical protein HDE_11767 [Halotydeus destructor]